MNKPWLLVVLFVLSLAALAMLVRALLRLLRNSRLGDREIPQASLAGPAPLPVLELARTGIARATAGHPYLLGTITIRQEARTLSRIPTFPVATPVRPVMSNFEQQKTKFRTQAGFIAALDQSGGSTPKALKLYGIAESAYSGDAQMMDLIHAMRTRIITSPSFSGNRVLAAILFENTMDREVLGRPTADYLWNVKQVVPILKVDTGLEAEANGVQLMKPMADLDALLARAKAKGIFGTKMRSVIKQANPAGIQAIVDQQFAVGRQIIAAGLVPIIEPEVDIHCPDKAQAEELLKAALKAQLDKLPEGQLVMLKLTIPSKDNLYADLITHPRVLKVVALSGGYSRAEANEKLARQKGMVASFSRALTEGLTAQQSAAEFDAALDAAIESIYQASKT